MLTATNRIYENIFSELLASHKDSFIIWRYFYEGLPNIDLDFIEAFLRANDDRERKYAIRDCLSAMETLMKKFTNTKDINEADRMFRENKEKWGPQVILNEGIKLWKLFHEDYTDIRHGNDKISSISVDQSIYFVDRILAYVNYICKVEQLTC